MCVIYVNHTISTYTIILYRNYLYCVVSDLNRMYDLINIIKKNIYLNNNQFTNVHKDSYIDINTK